MSRINEKYIEKKGIKQADPVEIMYINGVRELGYFNRFVKKEDGLALEIITEGKIYPLSKAIAGVIKLVRVE